MEKEQKIERLKKENKKLKKKIKKLESNSSHRLSISDESFYGQSLACRKNNDYWG